MTLLLETQNCRKSLWKQFISRNSFHEVKRGMSKKNHKEFTTLAQFRCHPRPKVFPVDICTNFFTTACSGKQYKTNIFFSSFNLAFIFTNLLLTTLLIPSKTSRRGGCMKNISDEAKKYVGARAMKWTSLFNRWMTTWEISLYHQCPKSWLNVRLPEFLRWLRTVNSKRPRTN